MYDSLKKHISNTLDYYKEYGNSFFGFSLAYTLFIGGITFVILLLTHDTITLQDESNSLSGLLSQLGGNTRIKLIETILSGVGTFSLAFYVVYLNDILYTDQKPTLGNFLKKLDTRVIGRFFLFSVGFSMVVIFCTAISSSLYITIGTINILLKYIPYLGLIYITFNVLKTRVATTVNADLRKMFVSGMILVFVIIALKSFLLQTANELTMSIFMENPNHIISLTLPYIFIVFIDAYLLLGIASGILFPVLEEIAPTTELIEDNNSSNDDDITKHLVD